MTTLSAEEDKTIDIGTEDLGLKKLQAVSRITIGANGDLSATTLFAHGPTSLNGESSCHSSLRHIMRSIFEEFCFLEGVYLFCIMVWDRPCKRDLLHDCVNQSGVEGMNE